MKHKLIIPGFKFAGIHAGIKDNTRKKDLTLIYSEEPQTMVDGMFTKNRVFAAPVALCREVVKKGRAQLIVINSGIANACTGSRGMRDARATQRHAAQRFGLEALRVLVSSTGKIGDFLPMKPILEGIKKAKEALDPRGIFEACRGIMTTDQYPKYASVRGKIMGHPYTIAVLAKGAGMVRPDMATMLCYIVTDLHFSRPVLKKLFRNAVNQTLNRITVDGDMSTNDTVIIMANGRAGNAPFGINTREARIIEGQLTGLLEIMARKITLDGEGATKCCLVRVTGARHDNDAKKIAYAVGNSLLVKTAMFGCDPNWGRIVAAVGYSGAVVDPCHIHLRFGPHWIVRHGEGVKNASTQPKLLRYMKRQNLDILVECGKGRGKYHVYMSDLTYDYIHLNAEYHT